MRTLLILCLLFPFICSAQESSVKTEHSAESHLCTDWQVLVRPTVRNPVNAFYRFLYNNGEYRMELKLSAGGVPFVVAQNAKLELQSEHCELVTLYNKHYQRSCKGCGSRLAEANIPGVTLSFLLDKENNAMLRDNYLSHIRLYLADNVLGGPVTLRRSELFREVLENFNCKVNRHK